MSTVATATKKDQAKDSSKDIKRKRKLGDLKESCDQKQNFTTELSWMIHRMSKVTNLMKGVKHLKKKT